MFYVTVSTFSAYTNNLCAVFPNNKKRGKKRIFQFSIDCDEMLRGNERTRHMLTIVNHLIVDCHWRIQGKFQFH